MYSVRIRDTAPPQSAADRLFGNTQPSILTTKTTAEIADAKLDNQTLFRQVCGQPFTLSREQSVSY